MSSSFGLRLIIELTNVAVAFMIFRPLAVTTLLFLSTIFLRNSRRSAGHATERATRVKSSALISPLRCITATMDNKVDCSLLTSYCSSSCRSEGTVVWQSSI
uniref:Uncharacterized protein n=1 Tax=Arundo donax TaxID=35708 RepID=A0A0A8Z7D8_ARUDO